MEAQTRIQSALARFSELSLFDAALGFFQALGYDSERRLRIDPGTSANFLAKLAPHHAPLAESALFDQWHAAEFLFQITTEEIRALTQQAFHFGEPGTYDANTFDSYLFVAIELTAAHYTRTQLAGIVRGVNQLFPQPVLVLLRHGDTVSLGIIHRRIGRRDVSRDVLEKVTLIKDVRCASPHRAHLEILADLSLERLQNAHAFADFPGLHRAWEATFDVQTLNKRFFVEIRNWFYWARLHAHFPAGAKVDADGAYSDALIRLLTRMIFCWFLREMRLLPEDLFRARQVAGLLRDWSAQAHDDDTAGRYYKAILQNLFFATLATPAAERQFRSARNYQGRNKHYGDQRFFRHVALFRDQAPVEDLYRRVPFLNGGLFENLDAVPGRDPEVTEEVRVDGFSDVPGKQPVVPDFLFFGFVRPVPELAALLGETAPPKARGLLSIFEDYKFTVDENTPLEQEIALDPELLGRTFENLLAAINPETGVTARKSTGSFYTPREIVHYMVGEALVRFLSGHLAASPEAPAEPSRDERLRELVSEEQPAHSFTDPEVERIVGLLSQLRILDPACGSGAFPMGLLQRLVHVLEKLDPLNQRWKAAKLALLPPEMRERAEEVFSNESFNYTRKLELIRDCIHGVDIQPIAIQISKLRFFLSLVIEQRNPARVRPLPNLETKFVCANALLGLPRPEGWELFQHQIEPGEKALLAVRSRYFYAQTREEKDKCKTEDRRLRRELSGFIESIGGSAAEYLASKVAAWDPYASDRRAGYFDAESMFGVSDGFDITIGNPPYVRADEPSEWNQRQRQEILASAQYETLWEKWDLYVPFIERGFKLLRPGGVSTLIVSDAFCHAKYAQKPQNWFLKHARILRLDFCGEVKIFDAAVHNLIYFFQRADGATWQPERRMHHERFGDVTLLPSSEQAELTNRVFFPEDTEVQTFACNSLTLETICYISVGMVAHADEKVAKGSFQLEDLVSQNKDATHPKPFVEGKHLQRWLPAKHLWLEWGTQRSPKLLRRQTFEALYNVPEKAISVDMSAGTERLRVAYDNAQLFHNHSAWSFVPWHFLKGVRNNSLKKAARYRGEQPPRPDLPKREELDVTSSRFAVKYLLGVMNSNIARDFLRAHRRSNIHLYPDDWKKLPIPDVAAEEQQPVVQTVDLIIALRSYFQQQPAARTTRDTVLLAFLDNLNDALVRELYFPEELHARGLHFGRFVTEAKLPAGTVVRDPAQLDEIRAALGRAADVQSPLRAALFDLGSLALTEQGAIAV